MIYRFFAPGRKPLTIIIFHFVVVVVVVPPSPTPERKTFRGEIKRKTRPKL